MYIVIGGGGLVGGGLARRLAQARHDVVVVDSKREVCEKIYGTIGALTVLGNATDIDTLEEAGMPKADVAVATMRSDADNLAFAVMARQYGVKRIFARMRNPRYAAAYRTAGVTRVMDLVDSFIKRLFLEIEQPEVRVIAEMGSGKASLGIVRVAEDSPAAGKTVRELAESKGFPEECLIVGIYREEADEFVIPRGNAKVKAGDQLFLTSPSDTLAKAAKHLSAKKKKKKEEK